jgi:hypothetical protein
MLQDRNRASGILCYLSSVSTSVSRVYGNTHLYSHWSHGCFFSPHEIISDTNLFRRVPIVIQ